MSQNEPSSRELMAKISASRCRSAGLRPASPAASKLSRMARTKSDISSVR